jgi:hypothetical protein
MMLSLFISLECFKMGMKDRRANIKHGQYSQALILPSKLKKGRESTLAADRLTLVDPRGEIAEDDLLEFLETYVEPNFWSWMKTEEEH